MNVTAKASGTLRSLPEGDAAAILDAARRAAKGTARWLVIVPVSLPGLKVSVTVGRPVGGEREPVVLSIAIQERGVT